MMNIKPSAKLLAIVIGTMLPLIAVAESDITEAVHIVGDGIANVTSKVGKVVSDTAITTQVKALLAVESDIPLNISVTTKQGVVMLTGVVDTELQASRIVELAASVTGVKDVNDSKLKIASSDSYFSDASCTAKVKGKIIGLANDKMISKGYDLHVETTNGSVHIFGTVVNEADIDTVKQAASSISGVSEVKVNIDVKR